MTTLLRSMHDKNNCSWADGNSADDGKDLCHSAAKDLFKIALKYIEQHSKLKLIECGLGLKVVRSICKIPIYKKNKRKPHQLLFSTREQNIQ